VDLREVEAMYKAHGHLVLRRARALLGDEEDARDLLQEVFASLVHRPDQFEARSDFTTWLYSATTHGCLTRLRDRRTRRRLLAERAPASDVVAPGSPEHPAMVRELLARLPSELREVAVYHHLDGMTHEEIAQVLGCSRRHVGDLLARMHECAQAGAS
jgi:RNA polymerase sigma-70 factor, ECF subfamily